MHGYKPNLSICLIFDSTRYISTEYIQHNFFFITIEHFYNDAAPFYSLNIIQYMLSSTAGTQPNQVDIQAFENVPVSDYLAFRDFDYSVLQGKTIYSTLRCENNAGLLSYMSSNGVKISHDAPVVTSAVVESMPLSVTEYKARTNYQSVTDRIRLKWTGFNDHIGIQQYKVQFMETCVCIHSVLLTVQGEW